MDTAGCCRLSMPEQHLLGFPEVNMSRLFDHMDATMAGWSVPACSRPPAAAGGAAAALAPQNGEDHQWIYECAPLLHLKAMLPSLLPSPLAIPLGAMQSATP